MAVARSVNTPTAVLTIMMSAIAIGLANVS
jgi:hypothetical protein